MSSNDRGDAPIGGQSPPRQRTTRPAPKVQRVNDPRDEVLSKRPSTASRPANAKRPTATRPFVVAPDPEPVTNGDSSSNGNGSSTVDTLEAVTPVETAESTGTNTSHDTNGAASNGSASNGSATKAAGNGSGSNGDAAAVAPIAIEAKKQSSRRRRPTSGSSKKALAAEAALLAPPLTPPESHAGAPSAKSPNTVATPVIPLAPDGLAPAIVPIRVDQPAVAPRIMPIPLVYDGEADSSVYPQVDPDVSSVVKGRTVIHYGPGGRRRRPRVRRVTRVIRHVDPWSVFKVALFFSFVLYGICLTAGVLLWNVAYTTGTIDNVERFFESFGWDTFQFKGGELYHNAWIAGLFTAVGLTGLIVLATTLFNLITDLVGGVRVTVLEEEVVERHPAVGRPLLRRRTGEIRMVNEQHQSDPNADLPTEGFDVVGGEPVRGEHG